MNSEVRIAIDSLREKGIEASYFKYAGHAVQAVLREIENDDRVGIGDASIIESMGLIKRLQERGNRVYSPYLEKTIYKKRKAAISSVESDVYITTAGALTRDGQMINTFFPGTAGASMAFGPKKVIVLCESGKIVEDLDVAFSHLYEDIHVSEALGNINNSCDSEDIETAAKDVKSMCSITTIIDKKPEETEVIVMVIDEKITSEKENIV